MAKAKIIFDLKDSEDLREYNLYNNANSMFSALFEISYNLKKKLHYQFDGDDNGAMDLVFKKIAEILEDNNVILEKLG
jgi:hypothetical protein